MRKRGMSKLKKILTRQKVKMTKTRQKVKCENSGNA